MGDTIAIIAAVCFVLSLLYVLLASAFGSAKSIGMIFRKIPNGEMSFTSFVMEIIQYSNVRILLGFVALLFLCLIGSWGFWANYTSFVETDKSCVVLFSISALPVVLVGLIIKLRKETLGWPVIRGKPAVAIGFALILISLACVLFFMYDML